MIARQMYVKFEIVMETGIVNSSMAFLYSHQNYEEYIFQKNIKFDNYRLCCLFLIHGHGYPYWVERSTCYLQ